MANKVTFGLKNVKYAPFNEGSNTEYGAIKPLPGAVSLTLEPKGDMSEFYADDVLYYSAANNQGYEGTLTIANITEDFVTECLGETKDSKDVFIENSSKVGRNFALLFEFDGDVKAVRHILYNCSASRPNIGSTTRTTSKEPNTMELVFVAAPDTKGNVKAKATNTTLTGKGADDYNNWFTKIYQTT